MFQREDELVPDEQEEGGGEEERGDQAAVPEGRQQGDGRQAEQGPVDERLCRGQDPPLRVSCTSTEYPGMFPSCHRMARHKIFIEAKYCLTECKITRFFSSLSNFI